MKTKVSTPRSFLRVASRSLFTVGLIAVFACGAAAQQWTGPDASNNISNANSGNVGIGTTSPAGPLHVKYSNHDALYLERTANTAEYGTGATFRLQDSASNTHDYAAMYGIIQANTNGSEKGAIALYTANPTLGERMRITAEGNVGIGTSAPGVLLHVNTSGTGTTNSVNFLQPSLASGNSNYMFVGRAQADGESGAMGYSYNSTTANSYLWFVNHGDSIGSSLNIKKGGNVGIGTANPAHKLTVADGWFAADNGYGLASKDAGGLARTVIYLDSANAIQIGNTTFTPNVVFNNSGNVGIGTTSPAKKLHVAGDIQVDGNIHAKYQDLAEWVPSSEQLSAGTVVVLDTTKSNQVISSIQSYDTRVAGVISAQPGITLGEGGEGKVLVATTGRVKVKVDASRGAIQIGDLLVTSDVSGVAMKSEAVNLGGVQIHRPGTIIGKALEPLAKGRGEILVLLSLQ